MATPNQTLPYGIPSEADNRPYLAERLIDSLYVRWVRYELYLRSDGYRVTNSRTTVVDWPVLVQWPGTPAHVRWSAYEFNGERSTDRPNETIPAAVTEWVESYLLEKKKTL